MRAFRGSSVLVRWSPVVAVATGVAMLLATDKPRMVTEPDPVVANAPVQVQGSAAGRPHVAPGSATKPVLSAQDMAALRGSGRPRQGPGVKAHPRPQDLAVGRPFQRPAGALPSQEPARPPVRVTVSDPNRQPAKPLAVRTAKAPKVQGFSVQSSQEAVEGRARFEQRFTNPDGTQTTRFFMDPVHYRRPDGSWAPIDTALVPRGQHGAAAGSAGAGQLLGWTVREAQLRPEFAGYADDQQLVRVPVDESRSVGFGLVGAAHVPGSAQGSSVTYAGVLPDTDVRFEAAEGRVKEQIIVRSAVAATSWVFPLRLVGVRAQLADGGVVFVDETGRRVAAVPPGYMVDSSFDRNTGEGAVSSKVVYELVQVAGQPALKVSVDQGWLRDPARVFPVMVDPSVIKDEATGDTFVRYPDSGDFSGEAELRVGLSYDEENKWKSFMKWASIGDTLANQYVLDADLWFVQQLVVVVFGPPGVCVSDHRVVVDVGGQELAGP